MNSIALDDEVYQFSIDHKASDVNNMLRVISI